MAYTLLVVLIVLVAILMIFIVLIQESKGGGLACFHQLILHLEIEIIVGIAVTLDRDEMFLAQAVYKADGFFLELAYLHRLTVDQKRIASRQAQRHEVSLVYHRLLLLLLRFR